MENFDLIAGMTGTPFGLSVLILGISAWLNAKFEFKKKIVKVVTPWAIGILLSIALFFAGKYFNFGVYAAFAFSDWKEWVVFGFVALSPGLIANGLFDAGILQTVLKWLDVEKKD